MEFHVARAVRTKYGVDDVLFNYAGNLIFGNLAACRKLAQQVNEVRAREGRADEPVHAAALFAMGLIDELNHAMVARYRETRDPAVLPEALRWMETRGNAAEVDRLLRQFTDRFPNVPIFRGQTTVAEWLQGATEGMPNREAAVEELLMLWLANINPAFKPFREFFDDTQLQQQTIYKQVTAEFKSYFATRPPLELGSLLEVLIAPMQASPDSLSGQLDFIRERWVEYLGEDMRRVLLAIDVLREEDIAIWLRFNPPAPGRHQHGPQGFGAEGFFGDEFVGFGAGRRANVSQPMQEYEAFSPDQAWMPNVVLIAKSTYVWLEQLSKKYQRHIHRLDQIPDEELAVLADRGLNGLWLIGLWERSTASQTIKRLRGQSDAVASAYSLKDYRIADDLGGKPAYEYLRSRAAAHGIRLASDMVPNHMGIDSNWVMEHPEWFLARHDSPFPSYRFEGPDLSTDHRYEIRIEDHYYDETDAAVVFQLRDRRNGEVRYVYHGNDGTTFAWNDTAQLNYSRADVREHVIQTILEVARQFPIIRFDAAMTLAKKHVQRLWFPLPGVGGSIPSRAESAMSQEEFDALMPNEFWREVVDRVAAEVPGTLLLAEAFWLLEGYFVRTLGMHRVYNSAFMNMLRDEENAKYRSYLKKTIEFDPDILKRYVNFMSNPDERTAIDQFGTGDKYFGTCTLLATLPGLPMFGHGQIEAFAEKYGMEFKRARYDEQPDEDLIRRHQWEIAPLLKRRWLFAESTNFYLYDFWNDDGHVNENVFAYSNWCGEERALVLYNNTYGSTRGTIHASVGYMDKGSGQMRQRQLSDGMRLPADDALVLAFKDTACGLIYLRRARDFDRQGYTVGLRGYQYMVLLHWHELRPTADQPWDRLCDALHGEGVYNLEEALVKLRLRPLHDALWQSLSGDVLHTLAQTAAEVATSATGKAAPAVVATAPAAAAEPAADEAAELAAVEATEGIADAVAAALAAEAGKVLDPADEAVAVIAGEAVEFYRHMVEECGCSAEPEADAALGATPEARFAARYGAGVHELLTLGALPARTLARLPAPLQRLSPAGRPVSSRAVWAPLLAWTLLKSLAASSDPVLANFDTLQLRAALAQAFGVMGMEGDDRWRAAARVRVLLRWAQSASGKARPAAWLLQESFWADGDVRWLAGVNESAGKVYVTMEQLDELVWWLTVPELLGADAATVESLLQRAAAVSDAAERAGYELPVLRKLLQRPEPGKPVLAKSAASTSPRSS